ncbi:hypothetical protein, unknown function [Leishmania tarentolae]|uniref:Uncharacterized protein n=1 Tax=Leishmania tarentolae TaxID=5689 RepID=A0A640KUR7_LEITA|nr:hypothetical protein, unknown function [Leishmania tarentolae]
MAHSLASKRKAFSSLSNDEFHLMPHHHAVSLSPRTRVSLPLCLHCRSFFQRRQECSRMSILPSTEQAKATPTGFPRTSPPSAKLPAQQQFVVEKQGSFDHFLWHTRVLTINTADGHVYLSKAHKVENLDYRCMNRIDSVELWPTRSSENTCKDFNGELCRRTFRIRGLVGVKTEPFFLRWLKRNDKKTKEKEGLGAHVPHAGAAAPQTQSANMDLAGHREAIETPALCPISDYMRFETEVWLIRCMTLHDLHEIADSFRAAIRQTSVLKGYEALKQNLACVE